MQMSGETKFFLGVILVTIAILTGAVFFFAKAPVEVPMETLVPKDAWATGSATPKLTLVEFSDFECPACGSAHPIVKKVVEKYKDKLRFVLRHFPLDQHTNAKFAANVAEAAGAQGKFWEMGDKLFQNQTDLSETTYERLAKELNLNMDEFTKAMKENTYNEKIQRDINDGIAVGINSTPTFFLNGKKLNLFQFTDLDTEIQKALQ